jgi:Right handed beta helix region
MRRVVLLALAVGFLVPLLASAPAYAQATRTWVSGVGDDANPCSRTAPCKTFAGAISKTAASGEIDCLDPGGFGGITITKAITLNCSATLGSILVAGTNGITIAAGASDIVVIRSLQLQGLGPGGGSAGLVGVQINSAAAVSMENCVITQFGQQGINDARTGAGAKLFIRNTVISHNGGAGIKLGPGGSNTEIEDSSSINNSIGVQAGSGTLGMIRRSVFSSNSTAGIQADTGGGINMDNSAVSNNGTGVVSNSNVRVSNSDVTFNTTGFSGTTVSYGNNRLQGNGSLGAAPTAAGGATNNLGEQ